MPGRQSTVSVLISAEHASRAVPELWRPLFAGREAVLETHRAWDPGTALFSRALAERVDAPRLAGRVTRLLVDLNRSMGHPRHFSEFSRDLKPAQKAQLIERYWRPHWQAYRAAIERHPGQTLHIACHSFTPVLDGRLRRTDIGLLYDPSRVPERAFCRGLARRLRERLPALRVRMNDPYRGSSNGLGQQHRRRYGPERLVTVELEINQALLGRRDWADLREGLLETLSAALAAAGR